MSHPSGVSGMGFFSDGTTWESGGRVSRIQAADPAWTMYTHHACTFGCSVYTLAACVSGTLSKYQKAPLLLPLLGQLNTYSLVLEQRTTCSFACLASVSTFCSSCWQEAKKNFIWVQLRYVHGCALFAGLLVAITVCARASAQLQLSFRLFRICHA